MMDALTPFNRIAELRIWSTDETKPAGKEAYKFVSDGTQQGFYIAFRICRSIVQPPELTEIIIKNLKAETRTQLQQSGLRVELRVGWENRPLQTIYVGALVRSYTARQGADYVTCLKCYSGGIALARSVFSRGYPPFRPVRKIIQSCADELAAYGITIDSTRIDAKITSKIGPGGLQYAGPTKELLDRLALQFGFSWSIQNGVFQAVDDATGMGRAYVLSAKAGVLISVVPQCMGILQVLRSVCITAVLIPDLLPGDTVKLESLLAGNLNGWWKMHTVTYEGSPCEDHWHMRIDSLAFGSEAGLANLIQNAEVIYG